MNQDYKMGKNYFFFVDFFFLVSLYPMNIFLFGGLYGLTSSGSFFLIPNSDLISESKNILLFNNNKQ
jgi:hypothetical protein